MEPIIAVEKSSPDCRFPLDVDNDARKPQPTSKFISDEKDKYYSVFQDIQDPVLLLDSGGKVDNFNRAWTDLFTKTVRPGTSYDDDDLRQTLPWLGKAVLAGHDDQKQGRSFETWIETPHGGLPFQINIRPIYDAEDVVSGTAITLIDISERKKEEMALCQREKLQGVLEMAGAVCHEMNQPLMAISGYSELLSMNHSGNQALDELIEKIKTQVCRLGEITHKLMGITKYETKDILESRIIDIDRAAEK
jgi:nitrogen-specific signal transduction histidine kinase